MSHSTMTPSNDSSWDELYRAIYTQGRDFLVQELRAAGASDPDAVIRQYTDIPDKNAQPRKLEEIYWRLLESAQNANMKRGVVSGSIGGIDQLGPILRGFDPHATALKYGSDSDRLLDDIERELQPRAKNGIRRTSRSIWPNFCRTALSGASFLTQFKEGADFMDWASRFYDDPRSIAALPLLLSEEIHGFGYALACDFLKELGFTNYGKPDVHVMDIFQGAELCDEETSPYQIQKIIGAIAKANNVSSYNVDKLFWLIGSGKFDLHPGLGNGGMIGRKKEKFIAAFIQSK